MARARQLDNDVAKGRSGVLMGPTVVNSPAWGGGNQEGGGQEDVNEKNRATRISGTTTKAGRRKAKEKEMKGVRARAKAKAPRGVRPGPLRKVGASFAEEPTGRRNVHATS